MKNSELMAYETVLDYKKCNEEHMKKPWLFFNDSWIWLVWDFHGVQEKVMKYIQVFHGVQIHGNLMDGKFMVMIIPLTGNF